MIIRLILLLVVGVLFSTVEGFGQNTWVKTYGGSRFDKVSSILSNIDHSFLLTGQSRSGDGDFTIFAKDTSDRGFVMKCDSNGEIEWTNYIPSNSLQLNSFITNTISGGYVTCSQNYSVVTIQKINSKGNIVLWSKNFETINILGSMLRTNNDEYVITGTSNWTSNSSVVILKIDSKGEILWLKVIDGSLDDRSSSIKLCKDACFLITGTTFSSDLDFSGVNKGKGDIFALKLDTNSNLMWKCVFGGTSFDEGISVVSTTDNGCIIIGNILSNDGDFENMNKGSKDIFVTRLNYKGEIVWNKTFGGTNDDFILGKHSIIEANDGFVFTGKTNSNDGDFKDLNKGGFDIFLTKINKNGDIAWNRIFGGKSNEAGISLTNILKGGMLLTGTTTSNDGDFLGLNKLEKEGNEDIFVMKLDSNGNLNNTTSINEYSEPTTTLSVHPNPFSNSTTVSYKVETPSNVRIELLNTLGQTIEVLREDYTDIGTYQLPLNISTLSSGMYSIRMISGSMNEVVPVCVVR